MNKIPRAVGSTASQGSLAAAHNLDDLRERHEIRSTVIRGDQPTPAWLAALASKRGWDKPKAVPTD